MSLSNNQSTQQFQQQQPYQFIPNVQRIDPNCGIHIRELDSAITEEMLWMSFRRFGQIREIKISKDKNGHSIGIGFITFINSESAKIARQTMNHERILNFPPILVLKVFTKEQQEQIMKNNLFISNIPPQETEKSLEGFFSQFGSIYSLKLSINDKDKDKQLNLQKEYQPIEKQKLKYGYIAYENENDKQNLLDKYENNRQLFILHDHELQIQQFQQERQNKNFNLHILEFVSYNEIQQYQNLKDKQEKENLIDQWTQKLKEQAKTYGDVLSMVVNFDEKMKKPYAFISFSSEDAVFNFKNNYKSVIDYSINIEINQSNKNNIIITNYPQLKDLYKYYEHIYLEKNEEMYQQIKENLQKKCQEYGEIQEIKFDINQQNQPQVSIIFNKEQSVLACEKYFLQQKQYRFIEIYNFVNYHNPQVDQRFIIIRNLDDSVKIEELKDKLQHFGRFDILKLSKSRVKPYQYFAIIVFPNCNNSQYFLLNIHDQKYNYLNKLFVGGKCKYITLYLPHKQYGLFKQARAPNKKTNLTKKQEDIEQTQKPITQQQTIPQFPNLYMQQMQQPQLFMQPYFQQRFNFMPQLNNYNQRSAGQQYNRQQNFQNQNFRQYQQRQYIQGFKSNLSPNYQQQNQQNVQLQLQSGQQQGYQQRMPIKNQNQAQIAPAQQQITNPVVQQSNQGQQSQPIVTFDYIKNNVSKFIEQPIELQRQQLGQLIFPRVKQYLDKDEAINAPKITGMLIDFSVFELQDIIEFLEDDAELKERVLEAEKLIKSQSQSAQQ